MSKDFDEMMQQAFGDDENTGDGPGELIDLLKPDTPPEVLELVLERTMDAMRALARLRIVADQLEKDGLAAAPGLGMAIDRLLFKHLSD